MSLQELAERRPGAFPKFPMVDVLRAFAAITVVVYHVIEHFKWTAFPITGPLLWFRTGGMGVDLFFVISGFVIALAAFAGVSGAGRAEFAASFGAARLARIVPLHYLTCLAFLIFVQPALLFDPSIWRQLLMHAAFIHNFQVMTFGGVNGANWSVGVEMQFYLMMLLLAPWLVRADWRVILLGGVAVAWGWRLAAFYLIDTHGALGPFPLFVGISQLPGMLDEFALGILLARFVRSDVGQRFLASRARGVTPLAAGAVLWAALTIYWRHAIYWDNAAMVSCYKTLLALGWALVVLTACCLTAPALVRVTAPLRYLGKISYGIYLWHLLVLLSVQRVTWVTPGRALVYILVLTFLLASGSWHLFELPITLRVRERMRSR